MTEKPELHESTSPAAIAKAQAKAIAEALLSLGGTADVDAISAACVLPVSVVARRLHNNSGGMGGGWPTLFRNEARGVWSLTAAGERVAKS